MTFRVVCTCGKSTRFDNESIAKAMGAAARSGWVYRNGPIGKSVCTMLCIQCRPEPLVLVADYNPLDAVPCLP